MAHDPIVTGLHHVTALAGQPQDNLRFYTHALGLRLVKRTVNFDDPSTYHLYYGDRVGAPGTLLTHFPHPHARASTHGGEEITDTTLWIPKGSFEHWQTRLRSAGVATTAERLLGSPTLRIADPDGMRLLLVEHDAPGAPRASSEPTILAIGGVTLHVPSGAETAAFLRSVMGFVDVASEGATQRLSVGDGGQFVDVVDAPGLAHQHMGAGTVHHVAWRVPDDAAQARAAQRLRAAGIAVTPVMDRDYFRSIYFRAPGNVIFEIATDIPGFAVDEPVDELGSSLKLPKHIERHRAAIEAGLPPLVVPDGGPA